MYIQGVSYPSDFEAKKSIIETAKRMEEKGYAVGTDGSLSVRVGFNAIWITVRDADKGALTQDQLIRVDLNGRPSMGRDDRALPEDLAVHLKVYSARKDLYAVIHGYPTHVIRAGLAGRDLSQASFMPSVQKLGRIPCLSASDETAERAAELCLGTKGILLKNDGCILWGGSIREAFQSMNAMEKLAETLEGQGCCDPGEQAASAAPESIRWESPPQRSGKDPLAEESPPLPEPEEEIPGVTALVRPGERIPKPGIREERSGTPSGSTGGDPVVRKILAELKRSGY